MCLFNLILLLSSQTIAKNAMKLHNTARKDMKSLDVPGITDINDLKKLQKMSADKRSGIDEHILPQGVWKESIQRDRQVLYEQVFKTRGYNMQCWGNEDLLKFTRDDLNEILPGPHKLLLKKRGG